MKRTLFVVLVGIAVSLGTATMAQAQATRTWVSGVGNDANPCSRTAPCKTFAGAISKTATGGEIDTLDPGGFGAVTITKSITIDGGSPGMGGILAALVNGVIVNATATSTIVLKNLTINGVGSGFDGIRYLAGLSLHLHQVSVDGMTGFCVNFKPTNAGFLFISDSKFTKCAAGGVMVDGTSAIQKASIVRSVADANTFGYKGFSQAQVNISDSEAAASSGGGYVTDGANAKMLVVGSQSNVNFFGAFAVNNSEIRYLNGSIGHSVSSATSVQTGGVISTTGTVFMP